VKTDGSRNELELRADLMRARLIGTIDALDRRRRDFLDVKLQLRRHAGDVLIAFGGLLFGAGSTAAVILYRHRRHEERLRRERMQALTRLWRHPDRIAVRPSALGSAVRMVLVALVTMATTTIASRRLEQMRQRPRLPMPPSEPLGL
jgi:hypothetical protein